MVLVACFPYCHHLPHFYNQIIAKISTNYNPEKKKEIRKPRVCKNAEKRKLELKYAYVLRAILRTHTKFNLINAKRKKKKGPLRGSSEIKTVEIIKGTWKY